MQDISEHTQKTIDKIARIEKMSAEEVKLAMIHQGIRHYWNAGTLQSNVFDYDSFRQQIKPGTKVLVNGMVAVLTDVLDEDYVEVEITSGVKVKVLKMSISDTL
ncbi:MAG: hypothetical protein OXT67_11880 [Zetaproteobacteria bacterium]|nr:hypothetical protein [Zetaproteobacteria bacterium]